VLITARTRQFDLQQRRESGTNTGFLLSATLGVGSQLVASGEMAKPRARQRTDRQAVLLVCVLLLSDDFLAEMGRHFFVVVEFHNKAAAPPRQRSQI
jgi:hypothetical protein